ncbi:hypothetical protein E2986_01232 [Frieseomelitta varia]|uniref:G2/M phase-specific E3 ubiquitin-protein ligase n=1 Tax=Frieseomelitta varia TaxID=561572 RepID=A0A833WF41_9HYME|nr:hypothetical protein E2986_01232 [Frieseomelitta varia]
MSKRNRLSNQRVCCFCGLSQNNELEFGKFYEDGEILTHYYCLLLSSNMQQRGKDDQGILGFLKTDIKKEILRGKRLVCSYCKKPGATLGCCNVKCKKIFHYPCGLRAGTLNQFFGQFRSYCIKHRPKQKIDIQVKAELAKTKEVVCCICYEEVDPYDTVGTMWAPCCKKNTWFHRKCVQQLAMSAGYFFKCPLCNDKRSFQKAMLEFGIFIPSQDASWELVPNAFQELLYRHDQCDASICLCPKGRKYTSFNAKWELALCRICGSQGIHMACGQLKWANPIWECKECISILGKSEETASSSTRNIPQTISDSEDSDSDISVGKDSPVPFTTSSSVINSTSQTPIIKQRPGPRFFKLRQLKTIKEMQNNNKHKTSENVNIILNMEQHSLQSTSSKEIFMNVSNSVTDSTSHNYGDNFNSTIQHSKSQLDKRATNFISLRNMFIKDNTNEKNYLSSLESNKIESNKSSIIHDSSPKIEKLLQESNSSQVVTNNLLMSNLNNETNDVLSDIIQLDNEKKYNYTDSISETKITNIISLESNKSKNILFIEQEQKIHDQTLQSSNELISSNSVIQPPCCQSNVLKSNLKRNYNETTSIPIVSCINETKRLRKTGSIQSSHMSLDAFTDVGYNKNNLQINNHDDRISNKKSHIQINQNSNADKDILHSINAYNILNNKLDTNKEKVSAYINIANETNKTARNIEVNNIKDYAEDASTSFIIESSNIVTNNTKINCAEKCIKLDHSKLKKSQIPEQRKAQNDNEMVIPKHRTSNNKYHNLCWQNKSETINSDCPQLIPEYVCLRDLKFRVHNVDNLQVILYDKYSVNINMDTTVKKNTTFDTPVKKHDTPKKIEQIFKTQNDTFPNFISGNIYDNDKITTIFINEQSENDQDDIKENLDPILTIPCKNPTDDLLTNTTLSTNNSNVSVNDNQSENRNLIYPRSKIDGQSYKTINLSDDTKNNNDAFTSCNHNYDENINDIEQNVNFDNMIQHTHVIHNMEESLKIDSHDSTKLVQRILFRKNYTNNKSEDRNEKDFKVSIDLKKIKSFVDNNPDLFSSYKKEKNTEKRFNLLKHTKNSDIDESEYLENFTLVTSKYAIKELTNYDAGTVKNIEDLITEKEFNTINNDEIY